LLEIAPVVQPLDGGDGRILEVAGERHVDDVSMIAKRGEGRETDWLELRLPGDRSERVRFGDAPEGAYGDFLAQCRFRDRREQPRVGQRLDCGKTVALRDPFEGIEGDIAEHRERGCADAVVRVCLGDGSQRGRIHQLGDGGAANPRIGILAGDMREQIAVVNRNLLDISQTDHGIDMLEWWLCAESVQQGHTTCSGLTCHSNEAYAN
jgi:hypothetical protein